MTIRPGPTTASSVLNFADRVVRAAWSSSLIVPRAPRMSPTCASSSTADGVPSPQLQQQSLEFTSFALSLKRDRGTRVRSGIAAPSGAISRAGYSSAQTAGRGARRPGTRPKKVVATLRQRVPGTSRDSGGKGPTSARTIRVHRAPPFVRGACARLHTRHQPRAPSMARPGASLAGDVVTSLVRALALHGVAMLRSHLASPLRPGRGVLIRSVSRRLGSVACVREDASPNEVSN